MKKIIPSRPPSQNDPVPQKAKGGKVTRTAKAKPGKKR